jgi:hypothetical protein
MFFNREIAMAPIFQHRSTADNTHDKKMLGFYIANLNSFWRKKNVKKT